MIRPVYYLPPTSRYVINVSGGRSSGLMLRGILLAHDGRLPDHAEAIFCNTGKERPETLDFVQRMSEEWDCPITWLEYRYRPYAKGGPSEPKAHYKVVGHNSASRAGEPFQQMLIRHQTLPNPTQRVCTHELKGRTVDRYMWREHRVRRRDYLNVIGFRKDETKRVMRMSVQDCRLVWPLFDGGITAEDVRAFWARQPFDLGIPSWKGNCDLCFMRGKEASLRILREEPGIADWWIEQERVSAIRGAKRIRRQEFTQFSKRHTVADLRAEAASTPELPFAEFEPMGVDCFCGD